MIMMTQQHASEKQLPILLFRCPTFSSFYSCSHEHNNPQRHPKMLWRLSEETKVSLPRFVHVAPHCSLLTKLRNGSSGSLTSRESQYTSTSSLLLLLLLLLHVPRQRSSVHMGG